MEWPTDLCVLFEHTADGAWVSGSEGRILFWNRAAEAILGYPAPQVVGQWCCEVFNGCDRNGNRLCSWPCPIKTLLHGGDLVQHFDMATRTRTGTPVWLDVSCITAPAGHHQPPTVVHLFRDITMAHQIEVLVRQQLAQGPGITTGHFLAGDNTGWRLPVPGVAAHPPRQIPRPTFLSPPVGMPGRFCHTLHLPLESAPGDRMLPDLCQRPGHP